MSSTSILSLIRAGKHLTEIDTDIVNYNEDGGQFLAQTEADHFWFTVRRDVVLSKLRKSGLKKGALGLDVGCGTGFTAHWLSENGFPTAGIDAYPPRVGQNNSSLGFVRGDIFSIEPKPEFDFLLLLDVLEHIDDDSRFLTQALKFLKPGGMVIISVPAFQWLWSPVDEAAEHLRRYNKGEMNRIIQSVADVATLQSQFYFYGSTLLPYWISRKRIKKLDGVLTSEAEAKPHWLVNLALKVILGLERHLLVPIGGLPAGSSLFVVLRKDS